MPRPEHPFPAKWGECRDCSTADEALRRCAAGDLAPDKALTALLSQLGSEGTQTLLGDAIWDALENREQARAERLAEVQKLWNSRRHAVHSIGHSVYNEGVA
jgi:hypothetical protein